MGIYYKFYWDTTRNLWAWCSKEVVEVVPLDPFDYPPCKCKCGCTKQVGTIHLKVCMDCWKECVANKCRCGNVIESVVLNVCYSCHKLGGNNG